MRIGLPWIAVTLVWASAVAGETPDDAASREAWQRHCQALRNHPDVVRLYLFEDVSAGTREIPSVAGEKEPLRPGGDGPLAVVDGRVPGKKAVRLDRECLAAKPFAVEKSSFTVEMWIRHHGQGALLGNGQPNGMLFAQGDGYWSGERMMLDTPSRRLSFMIGRPRPSHAVGVAAGQLVPEGAWHHLAGTWDGHKLCIYWNGMLAGAAPYDGQYTVPSGPLKIGYANAGVGSLELDVDELAVFGRALRAEEILAHALDGVDLPASTLARLVEANAALLGGKRDAAKASYEAVLQQSDVAPRGRIMAQFGLGEALLRQGKNVEGGRRLAALLRDPAVPEGLREAAVREFLSDEPEAVQAAAPAEVYQRLIELSDLDASDRITVRLCLAECYLRENRPALARAEFDALLKSGQLDPYRRWDVRLKRAHTYLAAKEYGQARAEYVAIAARADVPPEVSILACLASGHAFYREKAYAEAAEWFARTVQMTNAPAYLRGEAAERAEEMKRLARGLPARDPTASRVKLPPQPEPAVTLYVAPDGKADNPGTKDRPLATLPQARDAVRKLRTEGALPPGGVTVFIRGGDYPVDETFELSREDSGTEKSPIVYRAFPGERPVFRGGVQLQGFVRVTDPGVLRRLPQEARGRVVRLDLKKAGVTDFGRIMARGYGRCAWGRALWVDLYVDGRPMQLARWPNQGFVEMGRVLEGAYRSDGARKPGRFTYEGDRPKRWTEADDAWTFGYWTHLWAGTYNRIAAIDTDARVITTSSSSTGGFRAGYPYYVVNLLEELDRPGEWYLDRSSGIVYLWPPADLGEAVVEFPVFDKPFVSIEGTSHVTLRGITFELGRGDGIFVGDCHRVLLAGCTIRRLGGNAVAVEGGTDCGVLGCDIHMVGARGVILQGGELKSLTPGRHFVENCHVHDFTRVDRVYAPAVHLFGVGNRVAHNLLCDSPHHAIRLEGHEHTIELNEIHSVVYESDDQAGIDVWGSPILRGNVIRYNFWHHIGSGRDVAGQSGIRLDDMISTFIVYGNVFYRAAGGRFGAVQIHGGKDNAVDNNLFVDCQAAVSFSPWGEKRWKDRLVDPGWRNRALAGGIDITKPPFITRYPDLAHMEKNADRNFLRRNLVVDCAKVKLRDRGVNLWLDNLQLCNDPGFADPERRDFTLPDDSPVYDRFGFRPIPFREIGLYQDEHRATWPVEQQISPHYVAE